MIISILTVILVLQDVIIAVNCVKCAEDLSVLFLTTAYESQKVFNLKKKKAYLSPGGGNSNLLQYSCLKKIP